MTSKPIHNLLDAHWNRFPGTFDDIATDVEEWIVDAYTLGDSHWDRMPEQVKKERRDNIVKKLADLRTELVDEAIEEFEDTEVVL